MTGNVICVAGSIHNQRDLKNIYGFSSLQSNFAKESLKNLNRELQNADSIVVIENGKIYKQSTPALRIAKKNKWILAFILYIHYCSLIY